MANDDDMGRNNTALANGCDSLDVVHGRNGGISLGVLCETNESESTAAASVAVFDDDLCRWK